MTPTRQEIDRMVPDDLRYTAEHEWVRLTEPGTVRVGITAFAAEQLGDVVYVDLPEAGTEVAAQQTFGEVESTKSVSDLYAPVTGRVLARNEALADAPELVNSDPYGQGWMVEIAVADEAAVHALLDADAYRAATA
jgi:glycine cleavage system H protein